jgi:hypothetical protein
MRVINHFYEVPYTNVHYHLDFSHLFEGSFPLIGNYSGDYKRTATQLIDKILESIKKNNITNRQMIVYNLSDTHINCMSTLQFLSTGSEHFLVANFRSQHEKYGRPHDEDYLRWVMQNIEDILYLHDIPMQQFTIMVNVNDYHDYAL